MLTAGLLLQSGSSAPAKDKALLLRGQPIAAAAPLPTPPTTNAAPVSSSVTNQVDHTTSTNSSVAKEGFLPAGFDKLAGFSVEAGSGEKLDDEKAAAASLKILAQIPAAIKALNEKPVAVRGFMLPMKVEHGMVTEFLLLRNQMGCCFGVAPGLNEWIDVQTSGKGVKPLVDDLITVSGTFHISAIRENGYLTGLYKMDCERIEATP